MLFLCLITHEVTKAYWEVVVQLNALTSSLDGGGCSVSRFYRFTSAGKIPQYLQDSRLGRTTNRAHGEETDFLPCVE
jgi:hypothetical protein